MKKGFAILAVLLLCVAALSGCITKEPGGEKTVFKVGTEATFPPFETTDDNENIVGFDIDLIKRSPRTMTGSLKWCICLLTV